MMKRMLLRLTLLLPLLFLPACGSSEDSTSTRNEASGIVEDADQIKNAGGDLGARLLSLVPSRTEESVPDLTAVRATFEGACTFEPGEGKTVVTCEPSRLFETPPAALKEIAVSFVPDGNVTALRIISCCGTELPDPLQGKAVLKAEKLCSQLTLVASQSTRAYRITSPGKRDFVISTAEQVDGSRRQVSHIILLNAPEDGAECEALAAAERSLNGDARAPPQQQPGLSSFETNP